MKCLDVNSSDAASSITSSELLRCARECDPEAWELLVHTYSRRMYRWCRLAGLQPADAANVVQDAFAAVARKLGDFRREAPGDTFRGWLRRIVDNKIHDHFRRHSRQLDVPVGGTDAQIRLTTMAQAPAAVVTFGSTTAPALNKPALEMLEKARGAVGERDWKFFWRVAVDGQSAADVGREFGVSANTVRLVKMRVLRRLRGILDDLPLSQSHE